MCNVNDCIHNYIYIYISYIVTYIFSFELIMTVSSLCNKVHILLNFVQSMIYFDYIATAEWHLLT